MLFRSHSDLIVYFTKSVAEIKKVDIHSKNISRSIDYIELHLNERIYLNDIAKYIGIHPNYLSNIFKKEMAISISDYIIKRRIEAAANMLVFTEYSCAEISEYLSFTSQSYFIKVFKKEMSCTPNEYRNAR